MRERGSGLLLVLTPAWILLCAAPMWIVKLALRNPYAMAVVAAVILLLGVISVQGMIVDIFPVINIPVVGVVWTYPGLPAEDMETRVVFPAERGYTTTVNGISRMESESIPGVGLIQIYFEPGADIGSAVAQITSSSLTSLRVMPPAITPPNIVQFNASNVPVAQLTLTSESLTEATLFDYAQNFVRLSLFTIPGLSTPAPYGGLQRQINVDVDPGRLYARGLSPQDIVTALNASNLIIPAGTARIGDLEYIVQLNSSPKRVEEFKNFPVKVVGGMPVTLGQVAHVVDAYADQTNLVRINGKRATYLNILKKAEASTLKVVDAMRAAIPKILSTAPPGMNLNVAFDQSTFVRASIQSVLREGLIAAVLVSTMIFIFLGSWRSVFIVCLSIPLSILSSIIFLNVTGNSLNIMTLGGLSLAIGMLVDDATVEIENIHRNVSLSPSITVAILNGASQVALPAIVSTLSICLVFSPVGLLVGPARYLYMPLALSVVFAMLASYVLSRTLVPTLARMLMPAEYGARAENGARKSRIERYNEKRDKWIEAARERYGMILSRILEHPFLALGIFSVFFAMTILLPLLVIGQDFFPATDTGLMRLHVRARSGLRIEESEKLIERVENRIRELIPPAELQTINSTIGIPLTYNLAFVPTDNVGAMDSEVLIELQTDHRPTVEYQKKIRTALAADFPGVQTYFQPADIVSQVLSFGLSAPIDIQIQSQDIQEAYVFARKIRDKLQQIPGAVDVNIKQVFDYPTLNVDVDRVRAAKVGIRQFDIASSLLVSLSSSSLISPSFYLNPDNHVNYFVVTKTPLPLVSSIDQLLGTPVTPPSAVNILQSVPIQMPGQFPSASSQTLGNLAKVSTVTTLNEINHHNVQRVVDVTANVEDRDLGSTASDIRRAINGLGKLPRGMVITILGQSDVMQSSFARLGLGILFAVVLVYLLMVILFQSWIDPFIIMGALPGAFAGILWMLAITGTTINVVSLMGSIMAVGIAVSNSILMVSFANEIRGDNPKLTSTEAALQAGKTRLRPVIMTALAMILGMIPMALGLGEGGDQNAPLGRAVIGGLLFATLTTLLIVPVIYANLRKGPPTKEVIQKNFKKEERIFEAERARLENQGTA